MKSLQRVRVQSYLTLSDITDVLKTEILSIADMYLKKYPTSVYKRVQTVVYMFYYVRHVRYKLP